MKFSSSSTRTGQRWLRVLAVLVVLGFVAAACGGTEAGSAAESAGNSVAVSDVAAPSPDASEAVVPSDNGETAESVDAADPNNPLTGEFATLDGTSVNLETLQGEDVVLWFWAPW